jgi:uncharacterized protein (DUF58 family)
VLGVLALFGWAAASGAEGGWIFGVLGGVILTLFVVDTLVAQWSARRIRLTADVPATSWAGDTVATRFGIEGVRRPVGVRMASLRGSQPLLVSAPAEGELETPTLKRGVFPYAIFETTVFGPLGMAAVARTDSVLLEAPIVVGPLPLRDAPGDRPRPSPGRERPDPTALAGIRPYRAGDTRRRVHALQSARHEALLVRDEARLSHETIELVVALGTGEGAEGVAGRAAGRALDHLDARRPLILVTREAAEVKRAPVRSPDDVARRLAVAIEGAVPRPDHPHEFIGPLVPR